MGHFYNLKKSLVRNIIDFSLTALSDGQGNAFPGSPTTGMIFYRADLDKLYRRGASTWDEIDIDYFYFDLDSHATEQGLPEHSYISTRGFSIDVDEHFLTVDVLLGVSILNDNNLVKHDAVMDALFTRFLPTRTLPVYNAQTGDQIGKFTVMNDVEVMPMAKADQRPLQFLGVSLATDLTVNLASQ